MKKLVYVEESTPLTKKQVEYLIQKICKHEWETLAGNVSGHEVYKCKNCGKIKFELD